MNRKVIIDFVTMRPSCPDRGFAGSVNLPKSDGNGNAPAFQYSAVLTIGVRLIHPAQGTSGHKSRQHSNIAALACFHSSKCVKSQGTTYADQPGQTHGTT